MQALFVPILFFKNTRSLKSSNMYIGETGSCLDILRKSSLLRKLYTWKAASSIKAVSWFGLDKVDLHFLIGVNSILVSVRQINYYLLSWHGILRPRYLFLSSFISWKVFSPLSLGLALLGGLCSHRIVSNVNGYAGLQTAGVIAHETAHK